MNDQRSYFFQCLIFPWISPLLCLSRYLMSLLFLPQHHLLSGYSCEICPKALLVNLKYNLCPVGNLTSSESRWFLTFTQFLLHIIYIFLCDFKLSPDNIKKVFFPAFEILGKLLWHLLIIFLIKQVWVSAIFEFENNIAK